MLNNKYELVIFDWDGTLVDSEASIVYCLQQSILDCELPAKSATEIRDIIGLGMRESLLVLFPSASESQLTKLTERYRNHFFSHKPASTFHGVEEALYSLDQAGLLLAVATGKGRQGLQTALDRLPFGSLFAASRCADETRSKPHPQMLEELLEQTGVESKDALMVGDTSYDLDMANNVGMDSAAVTTGVHDKATLLARNPVVCVDSISALAALLNTPMTKTDTLN